MVLAVASAASSPARKLLDTRGTPPLLYAYYTWRTLQTTAGARTRIVARRPLINYGVTPLSSVVVAAAGLGLSSSRRQASRSQGFKYVNPPSQPARATVRSVQRGAALNYTAAARRIHANGEPIVKVDVGDGRGHRCTSAPPATGSGSEGAAGAGGGCLLAAGRPHAGRCPGATPTARPKSRAHTRKLCEPDRGFLHCHARNSSSTQLTPRSLHSSTPLHLPPTLWSLQRATPHCT